MKDNKKTGEYISGRIVRLFGKGQYSNFWFSGLIELRNGLTERIAGVANGRIEKGAVVECQAEYVDDEKYGGQYQPVKGAYIVRVLTDREDIISYLSSDLFPGVGRFTAEKLYDLFGEFTIPALKEPAGMKKAKRFCALTDFQVDQIKTGLRFEENVIRLVHLLPHMPVTVAQHIADMDRSLNVDMFVRMLSENNGYHILCVVCHVPLYQADMIMLEDLHKDVLDQQRVEMMVYSALRSFLADKNATYVRISDPQEFKNFFMNYFLRVRMYKILPDTWDGYVLDENCLALKISQWAAAGMKVLQVSPCRAGEDGRTEVGLYVKRLYDAEEQISDVISQAYKEQVNTDRGRLFVKWLRKMKKTGSVVDSYTDEQVRAVRVAFEHSVSFISGGPGCGKTQTVGLLLDSWRDLVGHDILLLAPTGKAVNRVKTQAGYYNAETVMRFLTMNRKAGKPGVIQDSFNQAMNVSSRTLIVVDEVSMLACVDAGDLLSFIHGCTIVFVGDKNQLAPIDAGPFLQECIKSQSIFMTELTYNFRTGSSKDAQILNRNAQVILSGGKVRDLDFISGSFMLIPSEEEPADGKDLSQAEQFLLSQYLNALKCGADFSDVLLLTPFAQPRYRLSSANLNKLLQNHINPLQDGLKHIDRDDFGQYYDTRGANTGVLDSDGNLVRVGDRVINTKNVMDLCWHSYENDNIGFEASLCDPKDGSNAGIFNGDAGTVVRVYEENSVRPRTLLVRLDGTPDGEPARYVFVVTDATRNSGSQVKNWSLAYVLTIHKVQGSEAKHVFVLFSEQGYRACSYRAKYGGMPFLTRNMLYTAVTRAKEKVYVIGSLEAVQSCMNTEYQTTNNHLAMAIREKV